MGLFGRFFRRSGERERGDSHRCMECGMEGGEHTDWCPATSEKEQEAVGGTTPDRPPEGEGRADVP